MVGQNKSKTQRRRRSKLYGTHRSCARARLRDCIFGQAVFSYVPFSVRNRARTQHWRRKLAADAVAVGTGLVAFERAVGRTVAAGTGSAAEASDGTPGPVIERVPNREGFDHHRWDGANGVRPVKPLMAKSSGSAAVAVDSMGRLRDGPVVVFGAERHDPR